MILVDQNVNNSKFSTDKSSEKLGLFLIDLYRYRLSFFF